MNNRLWGWTRGSLWVVSFMVLAGCKGFWDLPTSTGTGNGGTTLCLSSGVFYVLNQTTKQIAAYISSGTLENVSGSPYTLAAPYCIAMARWWIPLCRSAHLSLHRRIGGALTGGKQRRNDLL